MTAYVEAPARVLRKSAEALAEPRLIASVEDLLRQRDRMATARQRLHVLNLVEEFLRAYRAAGEAAERVRLTDTGGWGDDEAERLGDIAGDLWLQVEAGWHVMEGSWAARLFVVDEARDAGAEYAGRLARRRVVGRAVTRSGPLDWSRGRGAA
jgi:hypothetical protein